jgi:hypothetical protein
LYYGRKADLKFYLNYLFQGASFDGRSMLNIGGGSGLFSLYGACMGTKLVVCLEPELEGSSKGVSQKLRQLCDSLAPPISLIPKAVTFQESDLGGQIFDIILLHNSINHLDEEACINLQHSNEAKRRYGAIFQKFTKLSAKDGKLIIADYSRYNFWHQVGLRNPLAPTIE